MLDLTKTKNIIFDLGAVLLDIDAKQTIKAFMKLGFQNIDKTLSRLIAENFFEKFEQGEIEPNEFYQYVCNRFQVNIAEELFFDAWNRMLINFPPIRKSLLKKLSTNYRLFLLSNTNKVHYQAFISAPYWEKLPFEKEYYSHQVGKRKPSLEIYHQVVEESNLNPQETLFIDDRLENVEAAERLSIKTLHLQPPNTIEKLFSNIIFS